MRRPLPALALATVLAVSLGGCVTQPTPAPSPSASAQPVDSPAPSTAPTTLEELATALAAEGLVDGALLSMVDASSTTDESLYLGLSWTDAIPPAEQLDILGQVQQRIDLIVDDRPLTTRIVLETVRPDGQSASVEATLDPGRDALAELLEIVQTTPCDEALVIRADDYWFDDEVDGELVELDQTLARLSCTVDGDGVDLASAYDEITAIQVESPIVDRTEWTANTGTDAFELDLRAQPVEGRQQLFVDLMTIAIAAGAEDLRIEDYGDRVDIGGVADAAFLPTCQTLYDTMVAAGVERRTIAFSTPSNASAFDVCFLQP
jgi:hypothetical protein